MLRVALLLGVLGMTVTLAPITRGANPQPTDDLSTLQGNWKPLQCEFEGVPQMPADKLKQVTVVFDKSEYHLYFVDRSKEDQPKVFKLAVANIALDQTTKPRTITFEFAEGSQKGQKAHGIYEIAGNQLKLCYGPVDKPKPATFAAPPKSGYFLETWARQVK